HDAADDVLHLGIDVHDGEGVEQRANQRATDDDAEYAAASADEADAAQYDHEDDVEDLRADDHDIRLHIAGLTDPDEPREPGAQGAQHTLKYRQRPQRNARKPGGFGIVALRINEAAGRGPGQEQRHDQLRRIKHREC